MAKTGTVDERDPRGTSQDAAAPQGGSQARKPMVKPELTRHGSLPKVTGSFFGTFSPA
jgi:hypothetical protein